MKKLLYIIPAFLLSSCFFTVGDLPPDFCDISQSYAQINSSEEGIRCGDATVEYTFNNQTQLYKLILRTSDMVPSNNGSSQATGMTLTFSDFKPITAGDYLNDQSKGWAYSFEWYDYFITILETDVVSLSISGDSTISALVKFSAALDRQDFSDNANFEYVFRNIKIPSEIAPSNN
tara:strand:+ start:685 stop:1212 length:528 start_codon:yes stop_codon:yes gene_type:complete